MYLGKNILTNLFHVAVNLAHADLDDDGRVSVGEMFDALQKGVDLTRQVVEGNLEPLAYDEQMYALVGEVPEAGRADMTARMGETAGMLSGTGAGARLQELETNKTQPTPAPLPPPDEPVVEQAAKPASFSTPGSSSS